MNELASYLVSRGMLKTERIIRAFDEVDRKDFVAKGHKGHPHVDYPLPIGYDQTISQPSTVAFMLELLQPKRGDRVLDVGSGSGWSTALLSKIVGDEGFVCGVEKIPELVKFGAENVARLGITNARIVQAGEEFGWRENAPFDRILVSAAAGELPKELVDQLKVGGVMVIPVGNAIWKVTRTKGKEPEIGRYEGFVFVPLLK